MPADRPTHRNFNFKFQSSAANYRFETILNFQPDHGRAFKNELIIHLMDHRHNIYSHLKLTLITQPPYDPAATESKGTNGCCIRSRLNGASSGADLSYDFLTEFQLLEFWVTAYAYFRFSRGNDQACVHSCVKAPRSK